MHLFEIVSVDPLELHGNLKYRSLAGDGGSLLFLEQSGSKVLRHCTQLNYLESHGISRPYTGICYDHAEGCYWGCTSQSNDLIYKLTGTFREVDRLSLGCYDPCYGPVKAIAYDRQDDCLILTYHNRVVTVDKRSLWEKSTQHASGSQVFRSCIRSCGYHYYISSCCNMETLTIAGEGGVMIHSCLPVGHRVLGMVEACDGGVPSVRFLTVKHGVYYYLLKGVLVGGTPDCLCSQEESHPSQGCSNTDQPETGETRCYCHNQEECHPSGSNANQDLEHSHNHPCVYRYDCDCATGGSVSIIESIALEQTALSHILNAEGEKIQKVLAVSNRPSDFLNVNHSVLEIITRITHLEQVLFSKLDLACGALRELESRQEADG